MQQPKTHFTVAEYLAMEAVSETKNEYWDGIIVPVHQEVVGMAGASLKHARLVNRLAAMFSARLSGCEALSSDLRVSIGSGKYVYPDVVVFCGDPDMTDENPPALRNPSLLVEVASPSTESEDTGRKLEAYLQIPSLLEYWVARQDTPSITRYLRRGDEWRLRIDGGDDAILRSEHLQLELPLADIYRD
ncbi:MAG TPA: Uma2 family endonuclease [Rhodothermales bacterium]|nr:Uma2 family endonuclease [Rhodothermales bacterium]